MGLYIKGLKAPACCCKCRFSRWSNYGQVYMCNIYEEPVAKLQIVYESTKPDWCPVAEAQEPHGDLIDRDALGITEHDGIFEICNKIKCAPVIIEAEGSENE